MEIEAIKMDNGYFIPVSGKKDKIKVSIDEDIEDLDIASLLQNLTGKKDDFKEMSKDEFREAYGDDLYRKYLLLNRKSMEEDWEFLVRTKKDFGSGFEFMEEAIEEWNRK
jgi:hypothetical protein